MSLSRWQRNIVNESGDVIPNAEIEVFNAGTSGKPTLYSDQGGTSSITNPFNADGNGFAAFYVEGGLYDIAVNGVTLWEDVSLYSAAKDGGSVVTAGLTESVTLSTGTLTIPVGMSTIKLPTSVWDGSSNITISGFAFENGIQPEPGYEFALVIPRTGVASAGALGNEVLLQHGTSLQVSANGFADLPCYPNAADNPGTDPVQFAAPYYRIKMRVESYDGGGDPVVSVEELPGGVFISNDRGSFSRFADGLQKCHESRTVNTTADEVLEYTNKSAQLTWNYPATFSSPPTFFPGAARGANRAVTCCAARSPGVNTGLTSGGYVITNGEVETDADYNVVLLAYGEWY